MLTIEGQNVQQRVIENRSNLVEIYVHANECSGWFSCAPSAVTLDGEQAVRVSDVARFIENRHVAARLIGVDDSANVRACERMELTTKEE